MTATSKYDRVRIAREALGLTQEEFATPLDREGAWTGNIERGLHWTRKDTMRRIEEVHGISQKWLETGTGEMLIKERARVPVETDTEYVTGKNLRVLPITVDSEGNENIILVTAEAAAGYPQIYDKPEELEKLPRFNIPNPRLRNGTFRAFIIRGNSMIPTVKPSSIVIGQYVDNWKDDIKDDEVYIVVSNEGPQLKRLLNRIESRQSLVLLSDNEEFYTDQKDVSEMLEVWKAVAKVGWDFKRPTSRLTVEVDKLKGDVLEIRQDISDIKGLLKRE